MRGSFQWAMLRLAILALFVIPAALIQPAPNLLHGSAGWIAAVDAAAPVLALHQAEKQEMPQATDISKDVRESAAMATQAREQAMRALRQELARELVRLRSEQAQGQIRS